MVNVLCSCLTPPRAQLFERSIHCRINLYLLDSTIGFLNACPQDSELSVDSVIQSLSHHWPGAQIGTCEFNAGGKPSDRLASSSGGIKILRVASL